MDIQNHLIICWVNSFTYFIYIEKNMI